jgi:hypothetical protein
MSPAGNQPESGGQLMPQEVAELAGEITEAEDESRRRRLARQIAGLAGRTGRATRLSVRHLHASGRWLTAQALAMAPKVPIRSNDTLRRQYPGLQTEQLADRLVASAARASAGVGAAVGATAAVPFIPAASVELGVETLALVAIELKLIAELHEVYEMPAPGSLAQRMMAYTGAWAERRGVHVTSTGVALAVGSPLRRKLERRLLVKAGKSALALTPFLTGAVAGALIDHHETRKLGTLIRDDLRARGQS